MLKYMLDTNICIYVIKRKPLEVLGKFNEHSGQLAISSITMAELVHGAEKSEFVERNLRIVEDFCSRLEVLDYGSKAAAHYGSIRSTLERKGQTIGVNDLHIGGHCRSEGLILVSNNLKEFDRIEALRTENWIHPCS
jgi:tRNA(fMet)-specific endonuclease VapC